MKKFLLLQILVLLPAFLYPQLNNKINDINPAYLKLLPSDKNLNELKPSDIPSEQVLENMGFSDKEIQEALDFKFSRGKYSVNLSDTLKNSAVSKFIQSFGDTLITDTVEFPLAKIYGQDIFRNNNLSFFQKALDAKAPENYKVSSGDEISISIWGYSEYNQTLLVDEKGYINPDSYGRIYVKGLTFKKMRSLLKNKFSKFLDMRNSEIDVTLAYSRVITVNIVGEVYKPGSYTIPAINTAFNALIASHGPNQLGSVRNIYLKRDGKIVDSLDVYQFLFNPTRIADIYMEDGDYLIVPPAKNIVEVRGGVNRPYTYEAKEGETVADIIKYSGGYTTNAFIDVITLKRIEYNSSKIYDIYKDHINDSKLQNGDEIIVNTVTNKLSNLVSVKGSIGVSGDYEFIKGERLLDLLNRAKCIDEKTFLEKVYIIRTNEDRSKTHISINLEEVLQDRNHKDNVLIKEYDIVRVLSIEDFDENYFVSVLGAVKKPGQYDYGTGMTLQDLLVQAGGFTQIAEGSRVEVSRIMDYNTSNKIEHKRAVIEKIKIGSDLMIDFNAQNFILKPQDQVFVRENPNYIPPMNITLSGEVKYPGKYSLLSRDEKISSVIERAGGFKNSAYVDGVKMYRKFVVKAYDTNNNLNIPEALLDSILLDTELSYTYTKELLQIEREKNNLLNYDSIHYDVVYFDMNKAISNTNSKHNISLLEGDSIIVPKKLDLVQITGDLNNINGNSISVPFLGLRAHYYVNNFAGGYSGNNKKSRTVVVHANGVTKKSMNFGLFSISPKVKPGSTIHVINEKTIKRTKKEDIDYNKHIESVITKITAVISLALLIERLNGSF